MQPFVAYQGSGRIVRYGIVDANDLALQSAAGITFIEDTGGGRTETHYVVAGVVTARPPCPVTGSSIGRVITLAGVPMSANMTVGGGTDYSGTNTDPTGAVTLTLLDPGVYQLVVDCFPAQDYLQEFTLA